MYYVYTPVFQNRAPRYIVARDAMIMTGLSRQAKKSTPQATYFKNDF